MIETGREPTARDIIDTQFILLEEVRGPNLFSAILELASKKQLTVDFLRSALFQTIFSMAAAEKVLQFSHFDPHVRNIQLSKPVTSCLQQQDQEEEQPSSHTGGSPTGSPGGSPRRSSAKRYWEYQVPSVPFGKDAANAAPLTYYIPIQDSCGAHFVLIDFGTSSITREATAADLSALGGSAAMAAEAEAAAFAGGARDVDDAAQCASCGVPGRALSRSISRLKDRIKNVKVRIGPKMYKWYAPRLKSMAVNARMMFLSVAMSIPLSFYQQWKRDDYESYQAFNAVFIRISGLEARSWFGMHFGSLGRPWKHVQVRDIGMSDKYFKHPRLWMWYFYAKLTQYCLVGVFFDWRIGKTAITYDELLAMRFFRDAYARKQGDPVPPASAVQSVGTLEPYDGSFREELDRAYNKRNVRDSWFTRKWKQYG